MKNPNFTILSNEIFAVKNNGFMFDNDFIYETTAPDENTNSFQKDLDSFFDLDIAYLCKDKNGCVYAVDYKLVNDKLVPYIWQRVCPIPTFELLQMDDKKIIDFIEIALQWDYPGVIECVNYLCEKYGISMLDEYDENRNSDDILTDLKKDILK